MAVKKGYTSVFAFIGGIPEWRYYNYPMRLNEEWLAIRINRISPKVLNEMISKEELYILDVRPLDFRKDSSYIPNSVYCPLVSLSQRYHHIPKNSKVVVIDWTMKQSPTAARFLKAKGYEIRGILKGGLERWKTENFDVVDISVSEQVERLDGR